MFAIYDVYRLISEKYRSRRQQNFKILPAKYLYHNCHTIFSWSSFDSTQSYSKVSQTHLRKMFLYFTAEIFLKIFTVNAWILAELQERIVQSLDMLCSWQNSKLKFTFSQFIFDTPINHMRPQCFIAAMIISICVVALSAPNLRAEPYKKILVRSSCEVSSMAFSSKVRTAKIFVVPKAFESSNQSLRPMKSQNCISKLLNKIIPRFMCITKQKMTSLFPMRKSGIYSSRRGAVNWC